MIFIVCPFLSDVKCVEISRRDVIDVEDIKKAVCARSGIPSELFSAFNGCQKLQPGENVPDESTVFLSLLLPGGKGGFGSMLRAIGAQIEKTTNREACRDLTGRRLRDINEEQRLKKWLEKKAEREVEASRRRKERLERLKQQPKHDFHDPEYNKQRSELSERIDDALSKGLQKADPVFGKKRSAAEEEEDEAMKKILKKQCLTLGINIPSELEISDEDESSGENSNGGISDSDDTSQNAETQSEKCENKATGSKSESNSEHSLDSSNEMQSCMSEKIEDETHCENNPLIMSVKAEQNDDLSHSLEENCLLSKEPDVSKVEPPICPEKMSEDISSKGSKQEDQSDGHTNTEQMKNVVNPDSTSGQTSSAVEQNFSFDFASYTSAEELEAVGLDKLKVILTSLELKCGGTLTERARRLWSVKGLDPKDYPKSLKAKVKKK